jgi:hypothetical protein
MVECLEELEKRELEADHCAVWRLPAGTTLLHFVTDKEVSPALVLALLFAAVFVALS